MHYVHDIYVKIMKKMGKKFFLTYDGFEPTDIRVAGLALAELQKQQILL